MQAPLVGGGCTVFDHCVLGKLATAVTQASLPQLRPLQAFQSMLVAPNPGKAADPVHQFHIKAAGRACCWAEKQSASFCCLCQDRKDHLLLAVPASACCHHTALAISCICLFCTSCALVLHLWAPSWQPALCPSASLSIYICLFPPDCCETSP